MSIPCRLPLARLHSTGSWVLDYLAGRLQSLALRSPDVQNPQGQNGIVLEGRQSSLRPGRSISTATSDGRRGRFLDSKRN